MATYALVYRRSEYEAHLFPVLQGGLLQQPTIARAAIGSSPTLRRGARHRKVEPASPLDLGSSERKELGTKKKNRAEKYACLAAIVKLARRDWGQKALIRAHLGLTYRTTGGAVVVSFSFLSFFGLVAFACC